MELSSSPSSTTAATTASDWARNPKQARIKVVEYFTMKHLGYLCARMPAAWCSPEDVDKALTIDFPFTTKEDAPRDAIKLEKSFKRPKSESVFLCLMDGPKIGGGVPACYSITACTLAGELFAPWEESKKPQLKCWSLQGVLDCDDPELQALAKGGPGLGFAWLSFVLNRTAVGPARGLDNELVHESKGAVLAVPQVLFKSVPGLEDSSPRVRLILEPVV